MLIATILAVFGPCVFDDDVKATAAVVGALATIRLDGPGWVGLGLGRRSAQADLRRPRPSVLIPPTAAGGSVTTDTGLRSAAESVLLDWEAVRTYLAAHGHRLDADPPPRQFAGGLANLNYLIHLDGKPAVLRRPPMGELPAGAYDMAREFRILSRLPDALPFIARGLHLCDDPSIIGQRFQIIEYRPGLVIREHMPPELAHRPEIGTRLSHVLLETIAAIHGVDTQAVGLDDLGRPEGFLARGVAGWRKRGLAAMEAGTDSLHHDIGTWLEQNIVPEGLPGLLHNDFKLNNIILDPDTFTPRAVVDWDQGTRGDPLFDFATLLSYWIHEDDPWAMHDMEQMPAVEACLCTR